MSNAKTNTLVPVIMNVETRVLRMDVAVRETTDPAVADGIASARFLVPTFALILPLSLAWCRPGRALATLYRWLLLAYALSELVQSARRGRGEWEHREHEITAHAHAITVRTRR